MSRSADSFDNSLEKDQSNLTTEKQITATHTEGLPLGPTPNHLQKSFSVRKEEVIVDQIPNYWMKGLYFFTIVIAVYSISVEDAAIDVFISYATNDYKQHSLMSTINVVKSVIGAASLPLYARLSDTFGRYQLVITAIVLNIVGVIIMSQATNVHKYAAGVVFYSAGYSGTRILWQINLQDASTLRYRLLSIAVLNLSSIVETWTTGNIVDSLLAHYDWSFGIALWAFTVPLACVPYLACAGFMKWKAMKTDEYKAITKEEKESFQDIENAVKKQEEQIANGGSKLWGNIKIAFIRFGYRTYDAFWKVDAIGCLFVIVVLGCILVPLTLAGGTRSTWQKASTIVPLVIGFALIPVFILWEGKWASYPMIPFPLLRDRGIWAALVVGILYMFASLMPEAYAYPVLLVGMNASVVVATRTSRLLGRFVMALALPVVGYAVSRVRRSKGFILFGIVWFFVAAGMFIHFKGSNDGVRAKYYRDGVAASICVLYFGSAFVSRLVSVSAQACTSHEYMASVTALFTAFYAIGGSFGRCVTGAMWTQEMYPAIVKHMSKLGVDTALADSAYKEPYDFIETYRWGSPARAAVALAYAEIQRKLCIVGICLCVPLLAFAFLLRDHYLVSAVSLENEETETGSNKDKIIFDKDDDPIFKFIRKAVGRKEKPPVNV